MVQDNSGALPQGFTLIDNFINDNECFACGDQNPFGLHMHFYTDGKSVRSDVMVPAHMCGWGSLVHGGIIATLLDETMSWSAIHLMKKLILTRTMEIEFVLPAPPNEVLRTEGWIESRVKNTEAIVKATLVNSENKVCARSTGRFALVGARMMRRLKIMDEPTIAQFEARYEKGDKKEPSLPE